MDLEKAFRGSGPILRRKAKVMGSERSNPEDVRMRGFARRTSVVEVWAWLEQQVCRLKGEIVPLAESAGRVLSQPIVSGRDVPPFARAMMDGYAVRAADTLGASAYNPYRLPLAGESWPGRPFAHPLPEGQAVQIMTGAPLPVGADAVLPAEMAELEGTTVLVLGEVSPGKHVSSIGEDIAQGMEVLSAGRVLRPQDVGLLASLGLHQVEVVRRPRVRILVTGNELLPAGTPWRPYHLYDSNGPMLQALVRRDGGLPTSPHMVPDEPEALLTALRSEDEFPMSPSPPSDPSAPAPRPRPQKADLILISGGSSVGKEDYVPCLLAEHGKLVFHGLAMRPSSPAGVGLWEDRLVFLLPGNPVSCLCAYDFFAARAIRALGGRSMDWSYRRIRVPLNRKVSSVIGRFDYLRVRLVEGKAEPLTISGASILSSTTLADGFVLIPPESEGYPAGTLVEVFLYDG